MLTNYGAGPNAPDRPLRHVALFLATVVTTTWMGAEQLIMRDAAYAAGGWPVMLGDGLLYALPFLLFLTTHEFGHYLMARARGVSVSLPYFIPVPLALGTLGAVIRIREPLRRTRTLFDIGAAGPLAGFVIALALVLVGLATVPPPEYLLTVSGHQPIVDRFTATGQWPTVSEVLAPGIVLTLFGDTALWHLLMKLSPYAPPAYELQHYPLLLAGWLGLFFTALNLLPVGQLDGGHVVYALFGPRVHAVVARITTTLLIVSGTLGATRDLPMLTGSLAAFVASKVREGMPEAALDRVYESGEWAAWPLLAYLLFLMLRRFFNGRTWHALGGAVALTGAAWLTLTFAPGVVSAVGYTGWLAWSALILFLIKVDHPPVLVTEPLDARRRVAGYACLALFVLCFSFRPLEQRIGEGPVPADRSRPIRVETAAAPADAAPADGAPGEGTPGRIAAPGGGR